MLLFINKLTFKQNLRREGIIIHLNGTETQYVEVAEEFLCPELKDLTFSTDSLR